MHLTSFIPEGNSTYTYDVHGSRGKEWEDAPPFHYFTITLACPALCFSREFWLNLDKCFPRIGYVQVDIT